MAASCRPPGRPSPRPASASGSRCCPPAATGAPPSPPGRSRCDTETGASLGPPSGPPPRERRCSLVPSRLRRPDGEIADGSAAGVTAASPGAGGAVAVHGGGPGDGGVPVPQHDRAGGPEAGVGLLAPGAGQPAEDVDAPADADGAGAGVGLAERGGIGMPGDARPHLAPHDRHPQLIADHRPHGHLGTGSSLGLSTGSSLGLSTGSSLGLSTGSSLGLSTGSSLGVGAGSGLGEDLRPGIAAARRLGVAIAGRVGTAIVAELGEPAVRLGPVVVRGRASVLWPDLDLHVGPPVVPVVCVVPLRVTCPGTGACTGMTDRARAARPGMPGAGAASAAYTSCRAVTGRHGDRGLPSASAWFARCACAAIAACPPLVRALRAHRLWFSLIDGSGSGSRLDILAVNVRLIYALLRRGVWTIPVLSPCTGRGSRSPR